MRRFPGQPGWHRRLGFRIGVVVCGTLITFELVRRLLDYLLVRLLGTGAAGRMVTEIVLLAVAAIALAIPATYLLSRRLVVRLRRLADAATESMSDDRLPGPFEDSGNDEISVMASAMNSLRGKVEERSKVFAIQDIRRREWIAQVSHDLRTPLTAQAACLDRASMILQNDDTPLPRSKLLELVSVAKLDGDRVHTLADDLLEIARLDAGDRLHLEPVPPGELVSQAVRELTPLAAGRGIQLEVNLTSRLPVLNADGRRLMRAIENLVRNAIQHAKSVVEVIATKSGKNIRFEVRDDGSGLPKEHGFLDYLRRRGSDVRLAALAGRGSRPDSAGLGLVVAQRVAEAHNGTIDAYNLSRGGAAFLIDIPITSEASPADDT